MRLRDVSKICNNMCSIIPYIYTNSNIHETRTLILIPYKYIMRDKNTFF